MAEEISFRAVGLAGVLERQFMTLRLLNNAAILGIGYIVGLRYAAIICALARILRPAIAVAAPATGVERDP